MSLLIMRGDISMRSQTELAKWINSLAGDYCETWVGEQVAEEWEQDRREIERLKAENERLREALQLGADVVGDLANDIESGRDAQYWSGILPNVRRYENAMLKALKWGARAAADVEQEPKISDEESLWVVIVTTYQNEGPASETKIYGDFETEHFADEWAQTMLAHNRSVSIFYVTQVTP